MKLKLRAGLIAAIALGVAGPVRADLTLTVQASPGVDLNDIHVGQVFTLDTVLGSSDPEEYYRDGTGEFYYYSNPTINGSTFLVNPDASSIPMADHPFIVRQTIRAVSEGMAYYYGDFSDTTLRTNLDTYRGFVTNTLSFMVLPAAVATPEPSTLALVGAGIPALLVVGYRRRRRRLA